MIAALYVAPRGAYFDLPNVDPWDEKRDARRYDGPHAVVAHPPCSVWCRLAPLNEARYGRVVGDDGGCFASALLAVRRFGGVLEHPALTLAWPRFRLPRPERRWTRSIRDNRMWVCEVDQLAYGHPARKTTWLLYYGLNRPAEMRWRTDAEPTAMVSYLTNHGGAPLARLTKKQAKASPPAFRDALIELASSAVVSRRG